MLGWTKQIYPQPAAGAVGLVAGRAVAGPDRGTAIHSLAAWRSTCWWSPWSSVDLVTLPRASGFRLRARDGADRLAAKAASGAADRSAIARSGRCRSGLRDDVPDECDAAPERVQSAIAAAKPRRRVHYELRASRRGAFQLGSGLPARRQPAGAVAAAPDVSGRQRAARLSRHAAAARVCPAGPHQSAEPDGRAPSAADRPGQRIRAAARLHARRQLQAHRLAQHGPARQADGQGFSGQSEPADHLPGRLRADDDQHRPAASACWIMRSTRC